MRVALLFVIAVQTALCCDLVLPSVKGAIKNAEIIFRGSVEEIRDAEIVFRVDRVWKGRVPGVFVMPNVVWILTRLSPRFYHGHVKVGAVLLVYAKRMPELNISGFVSFCGFPNLAGTKRRSRPAKTWAGASSKR